MCGSLSNWSIAVEYTRITNIKNVTRCRDSRSANRIMGRQKERIMC